MKYIIHNGKIIDESKAVITAVDHSYRYGDGLFETMRVADERILNDEYHFERLFEGIKLLQFKTPQTFTVNKLKEDIIRLCKKNNCNKMARVRLSLSRGSGGVYDCDEHFQYLIECWPLGSKNWEWNENGLIIGIFHDAKKSCDNFANLKSANYLPYVMAAIWTKTNKLNEALILNSQNRICDGTIANVFWVKDELMYTPPLSEGCVAGVMRKRILNSGISINESVLTEADLLNADEVFLTNAISGIRWVKQWKDKKYQNKKTRELFMRLLQTNSL